jgi:hypothetical protein
MKNHEMKTSWKRSPEARTPPRGAGPLLAAPPCGLVTSELVSVLVSSCAFVSLLNFCLYNPWITRGLYIMFSSWFCFDLFLSRPVLSFRGIMAFANNYKEKTPSNDDHQDPKLK